MNTVFIGGSRAVSYLPEQAKHWLDEVIERNDSVVVGDANGADRSVQKYLADAHYDAVTVYCSGKSCRNNIGQWDTRFVNASGSKKKFQFYAAKDREMAHEAEFGLMIWDGKSPGTVLNILRLVRASKKAVLFNMQKKQVLTFDGENDWEAFLQQCTQTLRQDLENRALPTEWLPSFLGQASLELQEPSLPGKTADIESNLKHKLNTALDHGDPKVFVTLLGQLARDKGMSKIAKDTGLAREALYRALSTEGNPEFASVLKVTSALKLRLLVEKRPKP